MFGLCSAPRERLLRRAAFLLAHAESDAAPTRVFVGAFLELAEPAPVVPVSERQRGSESGRLWQVLLRETARGSDCAYGPDNGQETRDAPEANHVPVTAILADWRSAFAVLRTVEQPD